MNRFLDADPLRSVEPDARQQSLPMRGLIQGDRHPIGTVGATRARLYMTYVSMHLQARLDAPGVV